MIRLNDRMAVVCMTGFAALCSLVAAWLSAAGAWNRGGTLVERTLIAAVAVLLTFAVHQLPAVLVTNRRAPYAAGWALWSVCLMCAVWGHLTFFAAADGHAGDTRAKPQLEATTSTPIGARAAARPLAVVSAERATLRGDIARLQAVAANCRSCPIAAARITGLQLRVEALEVEEQEARRAIRQDELAGAAAERRAASLDRARLDPAARLVAAATGAPAATVLLGTQMAASICLELVACVLWLRVASLRNAVAAEVLPSPVQLTPIVTAPTEPRNEPGSGASNGMDRNDDDAVAAAVRRGDIKPTVAAIRRFLGCSQARAMSIRRRLLTTGGSGGTQHDDIAEAT
ncbi:hypothetical protein [Cupriavidus plantarum]|uniref:hypothetical protein n=1 Tax=Cupriavidus plantarum TaxID=942865 RepID=UPI000E21D251|nr:hypothetical protein [Cupriavidus plantarum]REE92612.1 hypothetical protein C7418_3881 [Cupriavidus plantarum]